MLSDSVFRRADLYRPASASVGAESPSNAGAPAEVLGPRPLTLMRGGIISATMNTKILVRRFGVLSMAKIMGMLYALFGLIVGAIFSLIALAGAALGSSMGGHSGMFGAMLGVGAIILFPIFYG